MTEREHRTHALNLVRAVSAHRRLEWCFDTEYEKRVRGGPNARNLFLGDSRYASFLRELATRTHRRHGVAWAVYKQHAFVWTEDVIVDLRATLPRLRDTLEQLRTEARYKAEASTFHEGIDEGPLLAHAFHELVAGHPSLRLDRSASNERELKKAFVDNQYVVGISWFLAEGWGLLVDDPDDG